MGPDRTGETQDLRSGRDTGKMLHLFCCPHARFLFKTTYFQQLVLLSNWHHLLFFLKLNIFNIFSSSLFVLSHCRIGWEKQTLCPTLKAILSRKFSPLNKFAYYSSKQSHLSSQKTDWKRSKFLSEYTKCVL